MQMFASLQNSHTTESCPMQMAPQGTQFSLRDMDIFPSHVDDSSPAQGKTVDNASQSQQRLCKRLAVCMCICYLLCSQCSSHANSSLFVSPPLLLGSNYDWRALIRTEASRLFAGVGGEIQHP